MLILVVFLKALFSVLYFSAFFSPHFLYTINFTRGGGTGGQWSFPTFQKYPFWPPHVLPRLSEYPSLLIDLFKY